MAATLTVGDRVRFEMPSRTKLFRAEAEGTVAEIDETGNVWVCPDGWPPGMAVQPDADTIKPLRGQRNRRR